MASSEWYLGQANEVQRERFVGWVFGPGIARLHTEPIEDVIDLG